MGQIEIPQGFSPVPWELLAGYVKLAEVVTNVRAHFGADVTLYPCFKGNFTYHRCCKKKKEWRGCFDAHTLDGRVYTDKECCGAGVAFPGSPLWWMKFSAAIGGDSWTKTVHPHVWSNEKAMEA